MQPGPEVARGEEADENVAGVKGMGRNGSWGNGLFRMVGFPDN